MYCPYCDMDFVEGVTICTDCSRPLIDKDEYLQAKKEEVERMKQRAKQMQEQAKAAEAAGAQNAEASKSAAPQPPRPDVYKNKSDRYEDLRSSALAFWIVGAGLTVGAILAFGDTLGLPVSIPGNIITKIALVVMAVGALCIAAKTTKSAQEMKGGIREEADETKALVAWFLETYTKEQVDAAVQNAFRADLDAEEEAIARMRFIHDMYIVNKGIKNEAFIDVLSEEVYQKMFES